MKGTPNSTRWRLSTKGKGGRPEDGGRAAVLSSRSKRAEKDSQAKGPQKRPTFLIPGSRSALMRAKVKKREDETSEGVGSAETHNDKVSRSRDREKIQVPVLLEEAPQSERNKRQQQKGRRGKEAFRHAGGATLRAIRRTTLKAQSSAML